MRPSLLLRKRYKSQSSDRQSGTTESGETAASTKIAPAQTTDIAGQKSTSPPDSRVLPGLPGRTRLLPGAAARTKSLGAFVEQRPPTSRGLSTPKKTPWGAL